MEEQREALEQAVSALEQEALPAQPLVSGEALARIREIDPSVQAEGDLTGMQCYPYFQQLLDKGYDPEDAFRLARFDDLMNSACDKARQSALNSVAGKDHLQRSSGGASDEISVPSDVMGEYRKFFPGWSVGQIARDYRKYKG